MPQRLREEMTGCAVSGRRAPPNPAQAGNPAWRSADPACYGRGNITVSRPLGAELSTVRSGVAAEASGTE